MQPKEKRNWLEQSKNCKQLKIKFEKKTKSSVFVFVLFFAILGITGLFQDI